MDEESTERARGLAGELIAETRGLDVDNTATERAVVRKFELKTGFKNPKKKVLRVG